MLPPPLRPDASESLSPDLAEAAALSAFLPTEVALPERGTAAFLAADMGLAATVTHCAPGESRRWVHTPVTEKCQAPRSQAADRAAAERDELLRASMWRGPARSRGAGRSGERVGVLARDFQWGQRSREFGTRARETL